MRWFSKAISTFFGLGFFPIAPGTAVSLITVLFYKFVLFRLSWPYFLGLLFFLFLLGVVTSSQYVSSLQNKDPSEVVLDEVLGQLLALFMLEPSWTLVLSAFFLFRFFDIIKPFGIKRAERFSKGWGIMLDDITAGLYTSIIINTVVFLT
ncbi:MAG: hypothetical protein GF421_08315 [Candidatus Aminicenantes bacterium]|nr:hypothetical protein [Candidatus Aminicenantes bacterium]